MQGPPMFVDARSIPETWVCNAHESDACIPGLRVGDPVQVNKSYPVERLVAEGYVGLYRERRQRRWCSAKKRAKRQARKRHATLHTGEAKVATVLLDDSQNYGDPFEDVYGDGKS